MACGIAQTRDQTSVPCIAKGILNTGPPGKPKVAFHIIIYLDHILDFVSFWTVIAICCWYGVYVCECIHLYERKRKRERMKQRLKKFFGYDDTWTYTCLLLWRKKKLEIEYWIMKSQIWRTPFFFSVELGNLLSIQTLELNNSLKKVSVTQSCPTLCDPMDCSPPGFSVHGIFQQKYCSG